MIENLKPCPFCGGEAHKQTYPTDYPNWNTRSRIYCDCCGAEIEVYGTVETCKRDEDSAAKLWNRRVKG